MNKKLVWGIIVVIVIILIALVWQGQKPVITSPIKIGVILPLSGNLAFLGEAAKHGAEMALNDYSDKKNKYELIFEDDQFDAKQAATAANKLISIDKVSAIVSFGSSGGNVVKPLAEKNKLLHFAVGSDPKIADGKYSFNHWTPPSEEVRALIAELVKRNIKKIAITTVNQDGMLAITSEIKKQIENTGISVVNDQKFNIGEKDFRTLISKLKETNQEIIVMVNYSPELEILGRQIKNAGIKTPMTSVEGFDQTAEPKLFSGYWYASASDPSQDFVNNFKNIYKTEPGFGTGNVYDIISMIISSAEKAQPNLSSENIISQLLKTTTFKGVMGDLSVGQDGMILSKATIKVVPN